MFNKGDKVRFIHSSGPEMLVRTVKSALVRCFWFDKNHAPHEHEFTPEDLQKVEAKGPVSDPPLSFGRRGE